MKTILFIPLLAVVFAFDSKSNEPAKSNSLKDSIEPIVSELEQIICQQDESIDIIEFYLKTKELCTR